MNNVAHWLKDGTVNCSISCPLFISIVSHAGVFLPGLVTQSMALIQPVLQRHSVPAYICGHVHKLGYLEVDGTRQQEVLTVEVVYLSLVFIDIDYYISGAGATGKVYVDDPEMQKFVVWTSDDAGFMTVELTASQMTSKFMNTKGEIIYTAVTKP